MNNFYTLQSLVAEIRYEIISKEIRKVCSSRKDQIDFFLFPEAAGKLTFVAASPGTALFLDPRSAIPSVNAATFFHELVGHAISGIEMLSSADRFIRITFKETPLELLFMPFSSRPNVMLLQHGKILSSFKNSNQREGQPAPDIHTTEEKTKPYSVVVEDLASNPVNREDIESELVQRKCHSGLEIDDNLSLRKRILGIDKRFPRGLIDDAADTCDLDACDQTQLEVHIRKLQHHLLHPETVSITADGNLSLLPTEFLSQSPILTFNSVNEAVRTLFLKKNREMRLFPAKNKLEKKLQKKIRGLDKQLQQFEKEPRRLQKADELEHLGHLLMSQPGSKKVVNEGEVVVCDWDNEDKERIIVVEPGETMIGQARIYYEKAARIRKEIAMSAKKKDQIISQKKEMAELLEEGSAIEHPGEFEKWMKRRKNRLQLYGITPTGSQPVARPYRLVTLENYEVWIGKNARSNDEMLTLSHKEDIWMHVRGASGSHVILRNRGNTGWPDHQLVLRAASFAAAYSRLAGSSLVPVIIAKRKHVRKPKGTPPGNVTVTRERVEMVTPRKPEVPDS